MVNRRQFLGAVGLPAATAMAPALIPMKMGRALEALNELATSTATPQQLATDESIWRGIQSAYSADRSIVNLNFGGVGASPIKDRIREISWGAKDQRIFSSRRNFPRLNRLE